VRGAYDADVAIEEEATVHVLACVEDETNPLGILINAFQSFVPPDEGAQLALIAKLAVVV
jgi:hypothetical protein